MARLLITSALAMLAVAGAAPAIAKTSDVPATTESSDNAAMTEKIRAKLTEDGYKDITILPTTYAVSATDKTGKPVLLLIGPQFVARPARAADAEGVMDTPRRAAGAIGV